MSSVTKTYQVSSISRRKESVSFVHLSIKYHENTIYFPAEWLIKRTVGAFTLNLTVTNAQGKQTAYFFNLRFGTHSLKRSLAAKKIKKM